jgi:hypothetical protein
MLRLMGKNDFKKNLYDHGLLMFSGKLYFMKFISITLYFDLMSIDCHYKCEAIWSPNF